MPNLSLSHRAVNTRNPVGVVVFSIQDIQKHFLSSIDNIKEQIALADNFYSAGKRKISNEILRAQVVFLDSAFDFFLHELLKLGILSMFHNEWNSKSAKYRNLLLSIEVVEDLIEHQDSDDCIRNWINDKYSSVTLMSFTAFKDVCNILDIKIKDIADKVFYKRGSTTSTLKQLEDRINELFFRRNQIAHQSDRKRENAKRQSISRKFIVDNLLDIQKIVNVMCILAEQKQISIT